MKYLQDSAFLCLLINVAFAEPDLFSPEEFITPTKSGKIYTNIVKEIKPCPQYAHMGQVVTVHYTVRPIENSKYIASSRDEQTQDFELGENAVIPGIDKINSFFWKII